MTTKLVNFPLPTPVRFGLPLTISPWRAYPVSGRAGTSKGGEGAFVGVGEGV